MKSITILPTILLCLTTNTLAAPLTSRQQFSSPCPFNYPATLNTTESHNGLIFTIASNNPATVNRAVQLRTIPISVPAQPPTYGDNSSAPGTTVQVAAIDASSPVLLGQLRQGVIWSENRSIYNQIYDLGQTGALVKVPAPEDAGNNARYELQFADHDKDDLNSEWYLGAGGEDGTYNLYQNVGVGLVNGFMLCEVKEKDTGEKWWQLFYQTYQTEPPERPECEYIGVRTTAAATIFNGKCDIGGYTA